MEQFEIDNVMTNLEDYLQSHHINTQRHFRCINPQHFDNNASMKFFNKDNKVYCFGCGASYNLVDCISIMEGIDQNEAFKKAIKTYSYGYTAKPYVGKEKMTSQEKDEKNYEKAFRYWHQNYKKQYRRKELYSKSLKPKFVVMENVEGLMKGNAWRYVQDIYKQFNRIGYKVHHWLLKGEQLGIPQKRHRVFFLATRLDLDVSKIDMSFLYEPVEFGKIKSTKDIKPIKSEKLMELINNARYGDRNLENACLRVRGKSSFFNYCFVYDDDVAPTITAHCNNIRWDTKSFLTKEDIINISTFPQNYDFMTDNVDNISYICGMSVPPVMIKRVAESIKPYLLEGKYDKKSIKK